MQTTTYPNLAFHQLMQQPLYSQVRGPASYASEYRKLTPMMYKLQHGLPMSANEVMGALRQQAQANELAFANVANRLVNIENRLNLVA